MDGRMDVIQLQLWCFPHYILVNITNMLKGLTGQFRRVEGRKGDGQCILICRLHTVGVEPTNMTMDAMNSLPSMHICQQTSSNRQSHCCLYWVQSPDSQLRLFIWQWDYNSPTLCLNFLFMQTFFRCFKN